MPRVTRSAAAVILLAAAGPAVAADGKPLPTSQEAAEGWIALFDGETTFGWRVEGEAAVKDGWLVLGGTKATKARTAAVLGAGEFSAEVRWTGPTRPALVRSSGQNELGDVPADQPAVVDGQRKEVPTEPAFVADVPAGSELRVRNVKARYFDRKPLFTGKDLSGWKPFPGDKYKSKFEVTKDGELRLTNGPGDLQTEGKYADFLLQLECKTNGPGLNSGVFFRCIPDQYQNGYEAQINNALLNDDPTKPKDAGTGAIYRRVPARKVVSKDGEWFTLTVLAHGPHLATWVNGYQTASWTDDRKPDDNPRKGLRTAAGHISLQGHDATTDLLFRNIRLAELKAEKK